jgi:hypothetical protein
MDDPIFPRRFTEAMRPGAYLRIVTEGSVGAGDEIRVVERPGHDLTIRDVFRIYTRDRDDVERLLAVPQMSESWRRWANDFLQKKAASGKVANRDVASPDFSHINRGSLLRPVVWGTAGTLCCRDPPGVISLHQLKSIVER